MNIVTKRGLIGLGAAALSIAAFAAPAQAAPGIGLHGPLTERYGFFPEFYTDADGTSLQLCIDLAATCGAVAPPNPGLPISFPNNFPDEMFYWSGTSDIGNVSLTLAQEAVYAGTDGTQAVFGRVRITDRGGDLAPNQWYRFITPYGQFDALGDDGAGNAQIVSEDVGCGATGCPTEADFGNVGASSIGPNFLTAVDPAPPAGFIGDGATPSTITGSTFVPDGEVAPANYFRIDRITGPGGTFVDTVGQTDQFVITGKLADDPAQPYLLTTSTNAGSQPIADGLKTLTLTVRNGGSGDLKIATTEVGANPDFTVTGGTCPNRTVNPAGRTQAPAGANQTCTVDVAFDPTTAGAKAATLHITEQGAGAVHDVALTGVGTKPVLGTDQGGLSFGVQPVGTTAPTMTATVRNTGNAPLLVNGATLSGSEVADYEIVASDCSGTTLAPNATCTVDVHFTPKGSSVRNAALDIASAAGSKSLSLSGIGSAAATGPNTVIIQQQVPAAGGAAAAGGGAAPTGSGATQTTLPKLTLKRLGMARRVRFATARSQGIRMNMELTPGTEIVKIEVFRRGGGKLKLISSGFKAPGHSGAYSVRQSHAALRRLLRRGLYEVHVTPGRSKTDLGTMSKYAFTVV